MSGRLHCGPGDLARIVNTPKRELRLDGQIVKLQDRSCLLIAGVPHWMLESPIQVALPDGGMDAVGRYFFPGTVIAVDAIEDECLRPIGNPGEHEIDEILQRVPSPNPKTEEERS
jgi:hypothetical protein